MNNNISYYFIGFIEFYPLFIAIHNDLQMMCTNESDYNLYFIISRSIKNRDDIYGKFGNSKQINFEKRFMLYDTNNPSYLRVSVPYDKTIMQKLGTKHEYLDNYINNKILLLGQLIHKVYE